MNVTYVMSLFSAAVQLVMPCDWLEKKFKGGGVLVEKLFCSFFNPVISLYIFLMISMKNMEKKKKIPAVAVGFHGNGGDFRALTKAGLH